MYESSLKWALSSVYAEKEDELIAIWTYAVICDAEKDLITIIRVISAHINS